MGTGLPQLLRPWDQQCNGPPIFGTRRHTKMLLNESVKTVHCCLAAICCQIKSMFDKVEPLVCLLLINPVSSAEAEHSFSSLLSAQIENLYVKLYDPEAPRSLCSLQVHQHNLNALDSDEILS